MVPCACRLKKIEMDLLFLFDLFGHIAIMAEFVKLRNFGNFCIVVLISLLSARIGDLHPEKPIKCQLFLALV
jgi:hypothetical protein